MAKPNASLVPIAESITPPDASPVPVHGVSITQLGAIKQPDTSPESVIATSMMSSSSDESHSRLETPFNDIGTLLEPTKSIDDYVMQFLIFQGMRSIFCFISTFLHLQLF